MSETAAQPPPPSPMRKIILIALGALLILFVYHVLSDRYTPYSFAGPRRDFPDADCA